MYPNISLFKKLRFQKRELQFQKRDFFERNVWILTFFEQ